VPIFQHVSYTHHFYYVIVLYLIICYFFPSGAYRIVIFQHVINEIRTFRSK